MVPEHGEADVTLSLLRCSSDRFKTTGSRVSADEPGVFLDVQSVKLPVPDRASGTNRGDRGYLSQKFHELRRERAKLPDRLVAVLEGVPSPRRSVTGTHHEFQRGTWALLSTSHCVRWRAESRSASQKQNSSVHRNMWEWARTTCPRSNRTSNSSPEASCSRSRSLFQRRPSRRGDARAQARPTELHRVRGEISPDTNPVEHPRTRGLP